MLETKFDWKIYHFDVKSTFLYGFIEEDIYVEQPGGVQVTKTKSTYGLK